MQVLSFQLQTWDQIPEQDNPAFDYINGDRANARKEKCLIICKVLPYEEKCVGAAGFVVIEVPLKGDVIRRGLFWHYDHAEVFAYALAKIKSNN